MKTNYAIHWFRRDLRIAGNENLRTSWKQSHQKVLGLFCFDSKFLSRDDFSANRFAFFLKTLRQLKIEMQEQGGDLLVVDDLPQVAFKKLFDDLKKNGYALPEAVSFGRDYEPFARNRDAEMEAIFQSYGVQVLAERDHLLIEPHEVLKDDGGFYQVYSPFARRWFEKLHTSQVQARLQQQRNIATYAERLKTGQLEKIFEMKWSYFKSLPYTDQLDHFETENKKRVTIPLPEAGFGVAFEKLLQFKKCLEGYKTARDIPSESGTSQLSIYLKNGTLTSSQIIATLGLEKPQFKAAHPGQESRSQYLKEIAWREFYYSILFHRPDCEKQAFLPQYQNIKWENDEDLFKRWCEGTTGFPIVDAGMRQLNETGWMHNRVRMIVASFLVKDLLIDWRLGENYFMKMLLDGDLAPNNGGWQWAASTGCDPQPYFRIFNPWLQAAKFDPDAEYIKKYVPELRAFSANVIHDLDSLAQARSYPRPVVDHATQKTKAVALFKQANADKRE